MKAKEAKNKLCPPTFNGKGDSYCVPQRCMWWIDEGMKVSGELVGQCAVIKLVQAIYDLGKEG